MSSPLVRHPLTFITTQGRNIETPGEDPYLTGEYAESFTLGMQEAPEDPAHIQASACCKHLGCYFKTCKLGGWRL